MRPMRGGDLGPALPRAEQLPGHTAGRPADIRFQPKFTDRPSGGGMCSTPGARQPAASQRHRTIGIVRLAARPCPPPVDNTDSARYRNSAQKTREGQLNFRYVRTASILERQAIASRPMAKQTVVFPSLLPRRGQRARTFHRHADTGTSAQRQHRPGRFCCTPRTRPLLLISKGQPFLRSGSLCRA